MDQVHYVVPVQGVSAAKAGKTMHISFIFSKANFPTVERRRIGDPHRRWQAWEKQGWGRFGVVTLVVSVRTIHGNLGTCCGTNHKTGDFGSYRLSKCFHWTRWGAFALAFGRPKLLLYAECGKFRPAGASGVERSPRWRFGLPFRAKN